MTYIFMAVHYPQPGTSDQVYARMPNATVHEGESRPREYFHLIKPD